MFRNMALSLLCLCLLFAPSEAAAQDKSTPNTAVPPFRYEVASLRPSRPGTGHSDTRISFGPDTYFAGKTPSNRFDA